MYYGKTRAQRGGQLGYHYYNPREDKMALWTMVGAVKKSTMWADAKYIQAIQSRLAHKLDVWNEGKR